MPPAAFGTAAKAKLVNIAATGEPEEQLHSPFSALRLDMTELCGLPRNAMACVGESAGWPGGRVAPRFEEAPEMWRPSGASAKPVRPRHPSPVMYLPWRGATVGIAAGITVGRSRP